MTPRELKALRAALGWSQQRLAEAVGVQRNTVNRWEMGERIISPMAAKLLATLRPSGAPRRSSHPNHRRGDAGGADPV